MDYGYQVPGTARGAPAPNNYYGYAPGGSAPGIPTPPYGYHTKQMAPDPHMAEAQNYVEKLQSAVNANDWRAFGEVMKEGARWNGYGPASPEKNAALYAMQGAREVMSTPQARQVFLQWHNSPEQIASRMDERSQNWWQRNHIYVEMAAIVGGAAAGGAFGGAGAAGGGAAGGGNAAASFFPEVTAGAGTAGGVSAGLGGAATVTQIGAGAAGAGAATGSFDPSAYYTGAPVSGGGGATAGAGYTVPTESAATSGGFYDPSGTFHAGAAGGDFGAVSGAAAPGGNAFTQFMDKYGKFIGAGVSALGQYEQNRIQKQEFARMQDAAEANRAAALQYASPENYNKLYAGYEKGFQEQYKPALLNTGEALALGEQGEQEAFAGNVARRNMQGSGLAQVGPQTISAGRQARYGEAVRGYYSSAADAARNAASGTQAQQVGASLGAPVPYFPRGPNTTQNIISTVGSGLASYTDAEALQRRQQEQDAMLSYGTAPAMYRYLQ